MPRHLTLWLVLLALMLLRAAIPNGYMVDPDAARAGHYALMPCPVTGWRWPIPAPGAAPGEMPAAHAGMHGASHAAAIASDVAATGDDSVLHASVDCPSGIMLAQAVLPASWWPVLLARVPARQRPLPRPVAPRIAFGPSCGPPVGAQAPPFLSSSFATSGVHSTAQACV